MPKLIKIPESLSLAFHSLAILSKYPDEPLTTKMIADSLGASSAHLSKILQTLEHKNYVQSIRGPGGGYKLQIDPDEITLKDIYEVVEGPIETSGCLLGNNICDGNECLLGELLGSLEKQFQERLSESRLSDLAKTMAVPLSENG